MAGRDALTIETIDSGYHLNDRAYCTATAMMGVRSTSAFDECDEDGGYALWADDDET